jgi:hypothetical protein
MATIAFDHTCDKSSAFVMDPNEHKKYGYITAFNGVGLAAAFPKDLIVSVPFNSNTAPSHLDGYVAATETVPTPTCKVVGVIEHFVWNGGVGDSIDIDFYVSQENAVQIKTLQQSVLKTTTVNALQWWIADYDQERKLWFEAAYPLAPTIVTGIITGKETPNLDADLSPVVIKDGIDVNVYMIKIKVAPAANQAYQLQFQNSAYKPLVKQWGLQVGTLAAQAVG